MSMSTEQERADFEAWHTERYFRPIFDDEMGRFIPMAVQYRYDSYQAGRAALQSPPNTGELPRQSREAVLRAMSRNYTPGKHTWDSLDSDACAKGADEIRQLRAALALKSQDREDADLKEALLLALEYWADRQQRYKNRSPVWVQKARAALGIDHARRVEGEKQ